MSYRKRTASAARFLIALAIGTLVLVVFVMPKTTSTSGTASFAMPVPTTTTTPTPDMVALEIERREQALSTITIAAATEAAVQRAELHGRDLTQQAVAYDATTAAVALRMTMDSKEADIEATAQVDRLYARRKKDDVWLILFIGFVAAIGIAGVIILFYFVRVLLSRFPLPAAGIVEAYDEVQPQEEFPTHEDVRQFLAVAVKANALTWPQVQPLWKKPNGEGYGAQKWTLMMNYLKAQGDVRYIGGVGHVPEMGRTIQAIYNKYNKEKTNAITPPSPTLP